MLQEFVFQIGPNLKSSHVIGLFESLIEATFARNLTYKQEGSELSVRIEIEEIFHQAFDSFDALTKSPFLSEFSVQSDGKLKLSVDEKFASARSIFKEILESDDLEVSPPVSKPQKKEVYLGGMMKVFDDDGNSNEDITVEMYHASILDIFESNGYFLCKNVAFRFPDWFNGSFKTRWDVIDFFRTKRNGTGLLKIHVDEKTLYKKNINSAMMDFIHNVFSIMTALLTNHNEHPVLNENLFDASDAAIKCIDMCYVAESNGSSDYRDFINFVLTGFKGSIFDVSDHYRSLVANAGHAKVIAAFKNNTDGGTEYTVLIRYYEGKIPGVDKDDACRFAIELRIEDSDAKAPYPPLYFPCEMFMPMALASIDPN